MMKAATEMRNGMVIRLDNILYRVLQADYHGGGGKMHGVMHAKLKKLTGANVTEQRFRQDERFEELELERQDMEFLYLDGDQCVMMHPETYEQTTLDQQLLGAYLPFLQPNQHLQVDFLDETPLAVTCPTSVELKVTSTPEPLHLQNSSVNKDATLENGLEVLVPQFIRPGDTIRIDVEHHKYQERVR